MKARWERAAMFAAAVACSLPGVALADAKADAQALFAQGNQLAGDGDFSAALEKFRAAYERYPSAKILLNIGTSLRQLGRNAEAAETYEAYLRAPDKSPERGAELGRILREIDALVGRVRVEVSPPEASVRLDGRVATGARGAVVLRVDPGEHTISADMEGLSPAVETVTVAAREEKSVLLHLVRPGTTIVVRPAGKDPGAPQRAAAFIVGGVGLAAVGVGAVFGVLAKTKNDDAAQHCFTAARCDRTGVALGQTASSDATVSTVGFAIAGVALATAVTLLVTAPARKPAAGTGVRTAAPWWSTGEPLVARW